MFEKKRESKIITIPNILSVIRILLIPLYTAAYLRAETAKQYFAAAVILAISCFTDLLDGQIARHFHMESMLGRILDPIADKATQFTVTLCLSIRHPILRFVLFLFIVKEGFQGIVGLIYLQKGKILPGALLAGKICTTVFFASLIFLVLLPDISPSFVFYIAIIDSIFLLYSFLCYFFAYFGENKKTEEI